MLSASPLEWSDWKPLQSPKEIAAPNKSGLYRVRDAQTHSVLYLGETGAKAGLAGRLSHLRTCFRDEMPYADPHTAGPALWAHLKDGFGPLEVSIAIFEGTKQQRRAIESSEISKLRWENGASPMASFGRMPIGWTKSSGNSQHLVDSGKRFRGNRTSNTSSQPSEPCRLDLIRNPIDADWAELKWSKWTTEIPSTRSLGIYRIRETGQHSLLYIGEGYVSTRLKAHRRKSLDPTHSQHEFFSRDIEFSWIETQGFESVQRKEIENDLIASHNHTIGFCPLAQFLG